MQPGDLAAIGALIEDEGDATAATALQSSLLKVLFFALLREDGALRGVAALRRIEAQHSDDLARLSGWPAIADYRQEIGDFCIARSLRGQGRGRRLAAALLDWVGEPVFTISSAAEIAGTRLLAGLGFRAVGRPWRSSCGRGERRLWIGPERIERTRPGPRPLTDAGGEVSRPKVLLLAAKPQCWPVLRLAAPLAGAGFRVAAAAPAGSLADRARAPEWLIALPQDDAASASRQLERWIAALRPDCLLPTDNRSSVFVDYLVARHTAADAPLAQLLARSLGAIDSYGDRLLKHRTMAAARSIGVAAPPGAAAADLEEALRIAGAIGFPVVLKRPVGGGGSGVVPCGDAAAVEAAFGALAMRDRHDSQGRRPPYPTWFPPCLPIEVQRFVEGQPAMSCAVAHDGRLLAVLCALAERTGGPVAPSSVVRLLHHEGMLRITAEMAAAFRVTGFVSFDFVIEKGTGKPWLIECNPRPIGIAHLGSLVGVDLMQAYRRAMKGSARGAASVPLAEAVVARFPTEWRRDPNSPWLTAAVHDVPRHEPDALEAFLATVGRSLSPVRTAIDRLPAWQPETALQRRA